MDSQPTPISRRRRAAHGTPLVALAPAPDGGRRYVFAVHPVVGGFVRDAAMHVEVDDASGLIRALERALGQYVEADASGALPVLQPPVQDGGQFG